MNNGAQLYAQICAIRVFGSFARGDSDELSDIDVLIIQKNRIPPNSRDAVVSDVRALLGAEPSTSWYSEQKIRQMYTDGDLFAWHVHNESRKLNDKPKDILDALVPSPYRTAVEDIKNFLAMLRDVSQSIERNPKNATYESGLLFLCARNIAMCASWYVDGGPYFGRTSPFQFAKKSGICFPLNEVQHNENMVARVYGHRGKSVKMPNPNDVVFASESLIAWGQEVIEFVQHSQECRYEKPKSAIS